MHPILLPSTWWEYKSTIKSYIKSSPHSPFLLRVVPVGFLSNSKLYTNTWRLKRTHETWTSGIFSNMLTSCYHSGHLEPLTSTGVCASLPSATVSTHSSRIQDHTHSLWVTLFLSIPIVNKRMRGRIRSLCLIATTKEKFQRKKTHKYLFLHLPGLNKNACIDWLGNSHVETNYLSICPHYLYLQAAS